MAIDEKRKVSELPELTDPAGFYMFGYKENVDGTNESVRVPYDILIEHINSLQLERRISIEMQSNEQKIPLGEETTIYNVWAVNVSKLEVSIDGGSSFDEIPLDGSSISYVIPEKTVAVFRAEQQTVDTDMSLYIYAKAKVQ